MICSFDEGRLYISLREPATGRSTRATCPGRDQTRQSAIDPGGDDTHAARRGLTGKIIGALRCARAMREVGYERFIVMVALARDGPFAHPR